MTVPLSMVRNKRGAKYSVSFFFLDDGFSPSLLQQGVRSGHVAML